MRLKKTIADLLTWPASKDLLASGVLNLLWVAFHYGFVSLLGRNAGPTGVGRFFQVFLVVNILAVVGASGLDRGIVRFVSQLHSTDRLDDLRKLNGMILVYLVGAGTALTAIPYFFGDVLADLVFDDLGLIPLFVWGTILPIPLLIARVVSRGLQGSGSISKYLWSKENSVLVYLTGCLAFILWPDWSGEGVKPYALGILLAASLSLFFYYKDTGPWKITYSESLVSKVASVSGPLFVVQILTFTSHWIDTALVAILMESRDAGIYEVSFKIAYAVSFILIITNAAIRQKIGSLYASDRLNDLRTLLHRVCWVMIVLALVPLALIFLFPEWFLALFGEGYEAGVGPLLLLVFAQFISVSAGSATNLLTLTAFEGKMQKITLWATTVNVVLGLLLIPVFGITGAALAAGGAILLTNTLGNWFSYRELGFSPSPLYDKLFRIIKR